MGARPLAKSTTRPASSVSPANKRYKENSSSELENHIVRRIIR
jgi:hypothetical protein